MSDDTYEVMELSDIDKGSESNYANNDMMGADASMVAADEANYNIIVAPAPPAPHRKSDGSNVDGRSHVNIALVVAVLFSFIVSVTGAVFGIMAYVSVTNGTGDPQVGQAGYGTGISTEDVIREILANRTLMDQLTGTYENALM